MSRLSLWSAASLVALGLAVVAPFPWAVAQPPAEASAPDPLDLVRGLREQGMSDLALEYLQELEKKPNVSDAIKSQVPLERAKCQLDAAVDEPDEGTRISLIGEAKEGFLTFVRNPKNASHSRMPEAFLSLARLSSLDARSQLAKARRMDVPTLAEDSNNKDAVDEAKKKQKEEAAKARPLFDAAANQLKSAVTQIKTQLDKSPDANQKKALLNTLYDAELARGTNYFTMSETFIDPTTAELGERDKKVEEAQVVFSELIRMEGAPARVTGVARAWNSECEYAKKELAKAEDEVKRIEASTGPEAEEAKRMVKFFKLRRDFLSAVGAANERAAVELRMRDWLRQYGPLRRAQSEAFAVRWYLGYMLQLQADAQLPPPPKVAPKTPQPAAPLQAGARARYQEAEKLYRLISQSDNEYTQRAARQRMYVVRRLLGEKDLPLGVNPAVFETLKEADKLELLRLVAEYPIQFKTFEDCQMASLIQMARTLDLQHDAEKNKDEIKTRQKAIVALLERARELATPQDNAADVADVNLRLIYYYQVTDQPYQAAILGEHMARTTKAPGGKSSFAGALALSGYFGSTAQIKNTEADKIDGIRKTDRDRAIKLAQFIDKQFPNDLAADRARHRLAGLLNEDQKPVEAYDALLKVRAGYESISSVRLFQGVLAVKLLGAKDSPLPENRRRDVYRRTSADLDRLVKPLATAPEEEVRPYIAARCKLVVLYTLQARIDPEAEKIDPGYIKARKVAEETVAAVPTFVHLIDDVGTKSLNLDGWEMRLLAEDAKAKAAFLEGNTLYAQSKYDPAYAAIGDILADMNKSGPFLLQVKAIVAAGAKPMPKKEAEPAPPPKKEPEKKGVPPAAKKEPEPKKAPEPKKEAEPKKEHGENVPEVDEDKAQKDQIANLAVGVDAYRQNLIVLALKIRVKKGEAEKGIEQLELLKKFGGSIEANIATLEQITSEMAAQIVSLKREGKPTEAKALADGFSKLLDKLSAEPGLPVSVQRFLGQSLILVGEFDKAVEALKKVPAPAKREQLFKPNDPTLEAADKKSVNEYRRAALELLRAYRQSNKFGEADAILADAIGTVEKPGWAANSFDFRKEKAYLFEAKGAASKDAEAKKGWGEALKEWSALVNIYRRQVQVGVPPGPGGGNLYLTSQNNYYEMYLQHRRCLLKANQQLLKGDPKLQKFYDDSGKAFCDLGMISGRTFNEDVREKYRDLLLEIPEVKAAYEKCVAAALPGAGALAKTRDDDALAMKATGAALPENDPKRAVYEGRAKSQSDDANWIRDWAKAGGKFFLDKPATN